MIEIVEHPDRLVVVSRTRFGMRLLFALLALFPLLAPYELLLGIRWQSYLHPFFALAAFISLGATALSALLIFAALAGLDSTTTFDATSALVTYTTRAPVVREHSTSVPFERLTRIAVARRDWSDGAPSFYLLIETSDVERLETATSWVREEVEAVKDRVDAFLAGSATGPSASS